MFRNRKYKTVKLPADYNLENKSLFHVKYSDENLGNLEEINNILSSYIYLSNPFPNLFVEKDLAIVIQNRICNIIDSIIGNKFYNPYVAMNNEEVKEKNFGSSTLNQDFDN